MQLKRSCVVEKWRVARKYVAILGGILLYLPIGVPWYFGNLAIYINSYFLDQVNDERDLADPQWIFSAFIIAFTLSVTGSGTCVDKIGVRPTMAIAMVIHSGATFLSYFAIQESMAVMAIVFGAIGGLGAGLAYGPPLSVVVQWMPRRVGVATGLLLTGFGGGSIFYNELITAFINPHNIQPDIHGKRTTYFSQSDIIERIPKLFLVLGCVTIVIQSLGVLFLRAPKQGDHIDSIELQETTPIRQEPADSEKPSAQPLSVIENGTGANHNSIMTTSFSDNQQHQLHQQEQPLTNHTSNTIGHSTVPNYQATVENGGIHQHRLPSDHNNTNNNCSPIPSPTNNNVGNRTDEPEPDKKPMELLKNIHFYILWFALAVNHYGYIIKNNYYKEFGQSRIHDDHFLTTTGTLSTVAVAAARPFWGWLIDVLGVKATLIVFMATTSVFCAYWYFSIFQSHILYMIIVIIISFILSGAFIVFPLAALKMFGETHYSTNYGLILSAQIVMNIISPLVTEPIIMGASWFWLFCSITILNAIGMGFCLLLKDAR